MIDDTKLNFTVSNEDMESYLDSVVGTAVQRGYVLTPARTYDHEEKQVCPLGAVWAVEVPWPTRNKAHLDEVGHLYRANVNILGIVARALEIFPNVAYFTGGFDGEKASGTEEELKLHELGAKYRVWLSGEPIGECSASCGALVYPDDDYTLFGRDKVLYHGECLR